MPDDVDAVRRRLRLPYLRRHAPEVLATAKAQRWDPTEVLRVLLVEEATGRDTATRAQRRKAAGFPSGKSLDAWDNPRLVDPRANPDRAGHTRVGRPRREPRGLRPVGRSCGG